MASETALSNRLRDKMRWKAFKRHEDKLEKGVADCSFCIGGRHCWMELKQVDKWPARPNTPLRLPHFTPEQRNWLRDKGEGAGYTWLMLQVGRDHYLFDWQDLDILGYGCKRELEAVARSLWIGNLDYEELANILIDGN